MDDELDSAVQRGDHAAVQGLLATGANPNYTDKRWNSCAQKGHLSVVKASLQNGEDIHATNNGAVSSLCIGY